MPDDHKPGVGRRAGRIWLGLLFGALLLVFGSGFSSPPRSDWWPLLYHFHLYRNLPPLERAIEVVNYDVCGHGTFRPFFHVPLYWVHLVFGSAWFWYQVINFAFYCLSVVLLYRLARALGARRGITLAFLTVFAFLFSHFDIVNWTFHVAIIAGFCLFLLGFLFYLSYLRSGRSPRLLIAALFFLAGLLCYEPFLAWPAAVFLLFLHQRTRRPGSALRATILAVALVYLLQAGILGYTRSRSRVPGLAGDPDHFISIPALSFSLAVTASGIFFNGLVFNLNPILTSPGIIRDNITRGGILIPASPRLREAWSIRSRSGAPGLLEPPMVIDKEYDLDFLWVETEPAINLALAVSGCLVLLIGILAVVLLRKSRRPRRPIPFIFGLYLLLTRTFLLYHGRIGTNIPLYILLEFRYQYFTNALVALLCILAADRLLRALPRIRPWVYALLSVVLLLNLLVLVPHLRAVNRQLDPLGEMLSNIRSALSDGRVHHERRLFLDDAVVDSLPPLCWNVNLSIFMEGTYQWIFPPERIDCFADNPEEAAWTIDTGDFSLKPL